MISSVQTTFGFVHYHDNKAMSDAALPRTLRATCISLLLSLLSACADPLIPYAVDDLSTKSQRILPLPVINNDPVSSREDYRLFRAAYSDALFCVPTRLTISTTPTGRREALSLERDRGTEELFLANMTPPDTVIRSRCDLYPIDRLDVRPVTGTADPTRFRVTTVPGSSSRAPFSTLVIIQVSGADNISGFKALLSSGAGFLLEARFRLSFARFGVQEVTIPVSLDQTAVTEQTE
jgi:hypothetical protein